MASFGPDGLSVRCAPAPPDHNGQGGSNRLVFGISCRCCFGGAWTLQVLNEILHF
ncbi:MAG: hypothetical protein M1483_02410 [Actinobacteria bacterium]|nr:hypothetical protein [Actinomycetota bacterium]MCL6104479.1 hypothetical protein [Actinomycetota bacterium]